MSMKDCIISFEVHDVFLSKTLHCGLPEYEAGRNRKKGKQS